MSRKKLEIIRVTDIEKRRTPSKHYVYVIDVQWSDGTICRIGRRFSAFFDMHMSLLERFPGEGGQKDPSKRIIPYLPGKILFQRSHTRDVTLKRLGSITEYCEALSNLPNVLSQSDVIFNFFQANSEDVQQYAKEISSSSAASQIIQNITGPLEMESYVAITDYKADAKTQINLNAGEMLEVVEKNENGWWLVCNMYGSNGWVPGAYLEKPDGKSEDLITEKAEPGKGTWYVAITTYEATSTDEVSFPIGGILEVLQKNLEGWWLASYNGRKGWVPGSYLQQAKQSYNKLQPGYEGTEEDYMPDKALTPKPPPKRSTIRRQLPRGSKPRKSYTIEEESENHPFYTLYSFETTIDDGLNFEAGQKAVIIDQADNGWWYVSIGDEEGWAPANFFGMSNSEVQSYDANIKPSNSSQHDDEDEQKPSRPSRPPRPDTQRTSLSELRGNLTSNFQHKVIVPSFNDDIPSVQTNETGFHKSSQSKSHDNNSNPKPRVNSKEGKLLRARLATPKYHQIDTNLPIENEKWFKDISRKVAEEALITEGKEGYFVVRRSKAGGANNPYSLTLYHRNSIFNFHIRQRASDGLFATGVFSDGEKTFNSVKEMVKFYHENTLVVGDHSNLVKLTGCPGMK